MKFWWGQNFNYRRIVVKIVGYNGKVYYIAIVPCLCLIGICLRIIPNENVQRSYGSLSPFFPWWQLLCDMPSKVLHNLRSMANVNLLSRFCNPRFNHNFFTFWSFSGTWGIAATRKTFFTPQSLNFFDKPTLLSDTKLSISKTEGIFWGSHTQYQFLV